MIAFGYVGVSDLVGAVKGEFFGELVVEAGVDVTVGLVAAVPLGSQGEARSERLFEGELGAGAIGGGDDIAREVVSADCDAGAVFPLFGEGGVKIISGIVCAIADGEEEFVTDEEGPAGRVVLPEAPFYCGRDFQFADGR